MQNLKLLLVIISGALVLCSQLFYLKGVYAKVILPSLLSWIGWSMLAGVVFVSQVICLDWQWTLTPLLLSAICCMVIVVTAIVSKNFSLNRKDWNFMMLGVICIAIYVFTQNAWYTTVFAILADLILGIPTIKKAYLNPKSEKSISWLFGLLAWLVALLIWILYEKNTLDMAVPVYLILFNAVMVLLTLNKRHSIISLRRLNK